MQKIYQNRSVVTLLQCGIYIIPTGTHWCFFLGTTYFGRAPVFNDPRPGQDWEDEMIEALQSDGFSSLAGQFRGGFPN